MSSPLESTKENLTNAINGEALDVDDLDQLDMLLSLDPNMCKSVQCLLPLITKLAQINSNAVDQFPPNLIPKILSDAPIESIFELIPPALFSAGLDQPNTAPLLVQMLQRVKKTDLIGLELCSKVTQKLCDPEITFVGQIERLTDHMLSEGVVPDIPDLELYESTDPQLQSRLMAINLLFIKFKHVPRFQFWDLSSPDLRDDPLLLDIHIIYIGDLCDLGVDISQQLPTLCEIYMADEPFVCFHIERIFLKMAIDAPVSFRHYDNRYGLVEKQSTTLLAILPPQYLVEHKRLIESLSLSSSTVTVFCNLSTFPLTFKMLNLNPRTIINLPFDKRAQLVAAATADKETARLFVGRFPTVIDEIVVPATNPEAIFYQKQIEANLKRNGLNVTQPPEVATAYKD